MQRLSYLYPQIALLKRYLTMTPEEQAFDFFNNECACLLSWLQKNIDYYSEIVSDVVPLLKKSLGEYYINESAEDVLYSIDASDLYSILDIIPSNILIAAYEECHYENMNNFSPSYEYYDYINIIQNQWLIHFTDEPFKIRKYGFIHGVTDISLLGLTTHLPEEEKAQPGFNFSYTLTDFLRGSGSPGNPNAHWFYGKHAVIFKASGIRVFHTGDTEYQTIFWGPSAQDIIIIYQGSCFTPNKNGDIYERDGWEVLSCKDEDVFCSTDLNTAVKWVIDNFDQYRKSFTCP